MNVIVVNAITMQKRLVIMILDVGEQAPLIIDDLGNCRMPFAGLLRLNLAYIDVRSSMWFSIFKVPFKRRERSDRCYFNLGDRNDLFWYMIFTLFFAHRWDFLGTLTFEYFEYRHSQMVHPYWNGTTRSSNSWGKRSWIIFSWISWITFESVIGR